jgi:hypothetical protein
MIHPIQLREGEAMPGITIVTNLESEDALRTARQAARELGFTVKRVDDWELHVQKGSFALSIFLGAFIAYCNFRVFIEETRKRVKIVIERNSPWWTGLIGISRVKGWAKSLADVIEEDIEEGGAKVIRRDEH